MSNGLSAGGSGESEFHGGTQPDPKEELSRKISNLSSEASRLQSQSLFSNLSRDMSTLTTDLENASNRLNLLRGKGYVHGAQMEEQLKDYKQRWNERKRSVDDELNSLSREVRSKSEYIEREVRELRYVFERDYYEAERRYHDVYNRVDEFRRFISSAEDRIKAKFKDISDTLGQIKLQLNDVEWSFNELEKSSLKLLHGEDLIYACGGQHLVDKQKNGPKGTIFLTGNRFIFEQNEDVVVSRTLLFFTKKEHVQKIIIDKPIGSLESIKDSEKGFIFKAELLEISFKDTSKSIEMLFKLNKDSTMLKNLIQRIISGDIDREKRGTIQTNVSVSVAHEGTPVNMAPAAVPAAAPEQRKDIRCPGCGANYDKPILKGMTSDGCPYCGATIRF